MEMLKTNVRLLICLIIALGFFITYIPSTGAEPIGPNAQILENSTFTSNSQTSLNSTIAGGYIFTANFNAFEQNSRWKAYVGNVTGSLTLDNAGSSTIFSWDLGVPDGEVYATRSASSINWSAINCTWAGTKNSTGHASPLNRTIEKAEDSAMSHTRLDNITATFATRSHPAIQVGETLIGANQCYSIYPYVNDSSQANSFAEVILYDSLDVSNGNVVYAGFIENNINGYRTNSSNGQTFDFQMVLPENGAATWASSTAYYFYVELT